MCGRLRFGGGLGAPSALRRTDPVTPGVGGRLARLGGPQGPCGPLPLLPFPAPPDPRALGPAGRKRVPIDPLEGQTETRVGYSGEASQRWMPESVPDSLRATRNPRVSFHFQPLGDGTASTVYIQLASKGRTIEPLTLSLSAGSGPCLSLGERTALEGWRQDPNKKYPVDCSAFQLQAWAV